MTDGGGRRPAASRRARSVAAPSADGGGGAPARIFTPEVGAVEAGPSTLSALTRSLQLLAALADAPRPRTLQELGRAVGCSTSTAHRILATMADFYLVEKDPVTRRYRLGPGVFYLADARSRQADLRAVAKPRMEWLSDYSLETVSLHLLVGASAVCLDIAESRQELRLVQEIGVATRVAELGAKAKVLLAFMPEPEQQAILDEVAWARLGLTPAALREELARIRTTGVARSFGERVDVAASMAAAIHDQRNRVIAALAIAGPKARWTAEAMNEAEPALRQAALEISHELGYRADGYRPSLRAESGSARAPRD